MFFVIPSQVKYRIVMKRNYDHMANYHAITDEDQVLMFEDNYLSHIEGKILTLIEGLIDISESQRKKAIKSLVRDAIWGDMHNGWATPTNRDDLDSGTTTTTHGWATVCTSCNKLEIKPGDLQA